MTKTRYAIDLPPHHRKWMQEVYDRNKQAVKVNYQEIWSILFGQLPANFHPREVDRRLLRTDGEELYIEGILALEGNDSFLQKIDQVIYAIRDLLVATPNPEKIDVSQIKYVTGLTDLDIHWVLESAQKLGFFFNGSGYNGTPSVLQHITVKGDPTIFYNYIHYPGAARLLELNSFVIPTEERELFTWLEQVRLNEKLDELKGYLVLLTTGQEVLFNELDELKGLYSLNKKNWRQMFLGKVAEMVAAGIISETISKDLIDRFSPLVSRLLEQATTFITK